ncbi:MAG: hypothetical protein K1W00_05950 [Lachnospiraceae bacterium]
MIWAALTVAFYSITAFGDKYISARLKCSAGEYTFIVSAATVFWLALCLPFTGWNLQLNRQSVLLLVFLTVWKVIEFYTTAVLLKDMEPYELKAWLGINVVLSYGINLWEGKSSFKISMLVLAAALITGIYLIITSREEKKISKNIAVCLLYIFSKFMYGMHMGDMSEYGNSAAILIIVLSIVAVLQLPRLKIRELPEKRKLLPALMSRLTNASGLITEAEAAVANIFFYTLIQPLQLFVLFVISLITRCEMNQRKRIGSIICVGAVFMMTNIFNN